MKTLKTLLVTKSIIAAAIAASSLAAPMTFFRKTTTTIHRRPLTALAAALALSFGATSQALAAPSCKADVFMKNEQSASIKVLRFLYTVNGHEESEPLVNKRLAPGETEEWPNQALNKAGEGVKITSTRIEYKRDNSGAGDGYGPPGFTKPFDHSDSYVCLNDRNYWLAARPDDVPGK